MNKQDLNAVRTAQDIERKYGLKFSGISKNLEIQLQGLTKVENELNSILSALIINLKDVMDTQKEVSLWFYEGVPTTKNKPYTSWTNAKDHIGDFYYNQLTGYVYQFLDTDWVRNEDFNLVQAMALTNAESDTSDDHERKVYFQEPVPPYSNGDWWVKDDGSLYICQLSKKSGAKFEKNDFINSSKYTTTVAIKDNDTITVLKGTVTEITESYVKYTDLSTGGSTTIAGENITTGNIKSGNYVKNASGTLINLSDGTIDTKNFKVDKNGNIKLYNGAKVIGDNGLMTSYLQTKEGFIGFELADPNQASSEATKMNLLIDIVIPDGFEVTKAKVIGYHTPIYWGYLDANYVSYSAWGYARALKLYKATNMYSRKVSANLFSEFNTKEVTSYSEISGALGSNGWTATAPNDTTHNTEKFESSDIKSIFQSGGKTVSGLYQIKLESTNTPTASWGTKGVVQRNGHITLMLVIEGYMSYS